MRLSKFLSITIFVTCLSLLYVYQQTEIFRLAYEGQEKQILAQELLDKNSFLRYNVKRNTSLVEIGNKVLGFAQLQLPENYRLVRLPPSKERLRVKMQPFNKQTLLSRIFGIKRQAEARTINP